MGTTLGGDGVTGAAMVSVRDHDTSASMMIVEIRPDADAASATADAAHELTCGHQRRPDCAVQCACDGGDV